MPTPAARPSRPRAPRSAALLALVVIGLPCAVLAKPPAVVIDRVPTLQEVVEAEGWSVTPTQSGIYKPGAVLVPNARGTHDVVATGCVAVEPEVELMSQSSIAISLRGGVKGSLGAGSAAASAGITKQLTFIDPEQRTIPLGRLRMTPACLADVEGAAKLRDLRDAVIVHDVLVAIVKNTVCKRVEASGKVVALGEAEAAGFSDCVQESAGQVPVGFKAVRLSLLSGAPTVAAVVAPVVAPVEAAGLAAAAPAPVDLGRGWVAPSDYAMRRVPAGTYTIGCTAGQGGKCEDDEKPARKVTLSRAIWADDHTQRFTTT